MNYKISGIFEWKYQKTSNNQETFQFAKAYDIEGQIPNSKQFHINNFCQTSIYKIGVCFQR